MSVGLLDTSVIIDWESPEVAIALHDEAAITAATLAELSAGPRMALTGEGGARRQTRLQQVEATFDSFPHAADAARRYGQIVAALVEAGRSHRPRKADLFISAPAHANGLTRYTRNPPGLT